MSIHSDIVTATAAIASGKVYPDAAPEDAVLPFVIYRRLSHEPLNTLQGYTGTAKSTFVFECWATTKAAALAIADEVSAAIEVSALVPTRFREFASGEEYEAISDQYVEPVVFSFWHS